jgi:hypothetical protein
VTVQIRRPVRRAIHAAGGSEVRHKAPIPDEQLAIHANLAALPQVAYQVPVDGRPVGAAGDWIGVAQRKMEGATYLFIEQNLIRPLLPSVGRCNASSSRQP